jgi:predicted negative regulator of RcsB-dependent stress response
MRVTVMILAVLAMSPAAAQHPKDLYFGEALFHANQGRYFDALTRLDAELRQHYAVDEPELDSLYYHVGTAKFSVGDFELRYRMHHRAGRAIRAVLEADVEDMVRNEAAFRLARIHFQKGQLQDALQALGRIEGEVPTAIRPEIEFLTANVYLGMGQPAEAVRVLGSLDEPGELGSFVAYNLGVALLQEGDEAAARKQLDRAGRMRAKLDAEQAIRDKANLVLGSLLLEAGDYREAGEFLDRVSIEGPFSNQALLSAGWAAMAAEDYARAVVPWSLLAGRDPTDGPAQEALLALPYAYSKLDVHGRAADRYGAALSAFAAELEKIDSSIGSIRGGTFLQALVREEIWHDGDWVIRLRSLPDTPETFYLAQLMASHDFQTGLQNYLDLHDLKQRLLSWQTSFDAFDEMVAVRRDHYEPVLPEVDERFRELDSRLRMRREQHQLLSARLDSMLTAPQPESLATRDEQAVLARIDALAAKLASAGDGADAALDARLQRLRGAVLWALRTEYHERLAAFHSHLQELGQAMAVADGQYRQFVRFRQAASHSYEGFAGPVDDLRVRVKAALIRLDGLMARQGRLLENVALAELQVRRQRLQKYQDDARFALADSYDRATQLQARDSAP